MSINDLPKDLIVFLGNMLSDRDLLRLSIANKRYHDIIKKYFKQWFIIINERTAKPILLIQSTNSQFDQIVQNQKKQLKRGVLGHKFMIHRFMSSYSSIYFLNFKYNISDPSKASPLQRRYASGYYRLHREKIKVAEGNTKYICYNKENAVQVAIWEIDKFFDIVESQNTGLQSKLFPNNLELKQHLIKKAQIDLNEKNKLKAYFDDENDNSYTCYDIMVIPISIMNKSINIYAKGYMNELLMNYSNPDLMATAYYIHDNGSRPYIVTITDTKVVSIHRSSKENDSNYLHGYDCEIMKYDNVDRILLGKVPTGNMCVGNSILLELNSLDNNKYVYIGERIYEFTTKKENKIIDYYSLIGNNDVPYPVAICDTYAYFMLDRVYVPKSEFPDDIDWLINGYSYFYGYFGPKDCKRTKIPFIDSVDVYFREF